jgi:hypothetical protein
MFTLEESALLSRMLRVVGWLAVCLTVGVAACAVVRFVDQPHSVTTHHSVPPPPHHHS